MSFKKLLLNRRGRSLFAKNLLGFFENKSISVKNKSSTVDLTMSLEDFSYVSSPDAKHVLRCIRKSNIDKLVFEQLNINSLRNKFDMLNQMIKGFVDVFVVSETKTDGSFPGEQFFIGGYHTPFRFDRNRNGGVILLYVCKDIPDKLIHCDFPTSESFHVDINLHQKKWLLNYSHKPLKNNICNHLDVITKY